MHKANTCCTSQILVRWKIIPISYAVVAPVSDFSENCLQLDKGWQTPNHYHLAEKKQYIYVIIDDNFAKEKQCTINLFAADSVLKDVAH